MEDTNIILNNEFEESVRLIKSSKKSFDNDTLLKLYGYYKQAIIGDCNILEPSFWQLKEKAKWDAWNQHKSMKKTQAMKQYIKLVNKLLE